MDHHIPVARPDIGQDELEKVVDAVKSGWVGSKGPFIKQFESSFSSYLGSRHGVAVCNGTAALHLALAALGVGRGDKVLVPSLTFIAAANAVTYTGASPVFVDSHPDYWCIDPEAVRKSITHDTKAIMLVHLYGHACDIDPILEIARGRGVYVVEDCAEAHGAEYKGKRVGSFGDVSCFSFYGNKTITTGEGGMCVTNDDEVAERIRILRDHGMDPSRRYWHEVIGFNYRMTNLQAALGVAQLQKIDRLVARKREIARTYKELIGQVGGITHPPEMPWAKNVYWFYSVRVGANLRNRVMTYMDEQGIETRPFFYPIHMLPPYQQNLNLPTAQELSATGLNLPSGPVITDEEIRTTATCLRRVLVG